MAIYFRSKFSLEYIGEELQDSVWILNSILVFDSSVLVSVGMFWHRIYLFFCVLSVLSANR